MSKPIIRKHSARVLTLKNVVDSQGVERTLHFTLIGGKWHYSGTSEINVSLSGADGFWKETFAKIISMGGGFSLSQIKRSFYHGPNKSAKNYIRTWETNITKQQYQLERKGIPF